MGPKKQKQTMSLGTFLGDQSLGSWADEMEDMPMPSSDQKSYGSREPRGFQAGPRPDREDRFPPREPLPLPSAPPYTAHLGNLSFDVTAADIEEFFAGCEVTNVRIVEDKLDRKPKGFGYVEFKTLDGLKQALTKSNTSFQNRQVRVSVADPPKDRPEQKAFDDWTRKGPLPELPQNARRTSAGPPGRSFGDNFSDAGSERGGSLRMERGGSRRGAPAFEGDGKSRDFGNWERKGPPTPVDRAPPSREGRPSRNLDRGLDRSFERRPSPAWGEGRSQDSGSRPPRPAPPERQPTAAEMDNQWRARMRPDPPAKSEASKSPTPDPSTPSSPAASAAVPAQAPAPAPAPAPASRPRLNLQKRTVSEVPTIDTSHAADSKASPFGSARPIDTASKDAAIYEKREQLRKQKDEEDKARIDKEKEQKAAEKAEKKARGESVPSTPTAGGFPENGGDRRGSRKVEREPENGERKKEKTGQQYEILRRMADHEGEEEENSTAGAGDEIADGNIVDDKSVKPKEVVRDMSSGKKDSEPSAEKMEEEGWSTITSAKEKSRHRKRNSMAASRAMAS